MKMLKKLALVSAVSMISAGAFAMEAMDDESMASATGQDGITILISPAAVTGKNIADLNSSVTEATLDAIDAGGVVSAATALTDATNKAFKGLSIKQIVIHDNDGWTVAGGGTASTANSGALVIGSGVAADKESTVVIADDTTPIEINIDMVGNHLGGAGGGAMLNVQIKTPKLAIATGAIYVADSYSALGVDENAATAADAVLLGDDLDNNVANDGNAHRGRIRIMSGLSVVMGASTTNIQLGNESQTLIAALPEGATNPTGMIRMDATLNGGLAINNFELIDAGGGITGGSIKVGQVKVTNAGGTDLDILAVVNVEDDLTTLNANYAGPAATEGGLVVTIGKLGTAAGGADIALNNVVLGSGTAKGLGDVQLLGLNLSGTSLIIRGH